MKKAVLITFGCQMNEYDSGRLADILKEKGWQITKNQAEADLIFYNTCSIREKAAQKILNHLEQLKKVKQVNKGLVIGVGGCVAQQEGENLIKEAPWVDFVVGPQNLPEIPAILESLKKSAGPIIKLNMNDEVAWGENNLKSLGYPTLTNKKQAPLSSFITIMQGCNNFCTYCVVPYLRGREYSRGSEDILQEITKLVNNGSREITFLGQNVNSYGENLKGDINFLALLKKAAEIKDLWRLRFTTSHPKDCSEDLISLFGSLKKLGQHLHLPVQSGADNLLEKMGRKYTRHKYLTLVEKLKKVSPNMALSTDIIVGFPGETESDFQETLSLLKEVEFDSIFSFKYSDRPQTKALNFENKINEELKSERLTILQNLQKQISLEKNKAHIGEELEVLVDHKKIKFKGQLGGRANNFKIVNFEGEENLIGSLVKVKVTKATSFSLKGTLV